MYSSRVLAQDLAILSLNVEKTVNQIEWPYLFVVLRKFNLGENLISQILYSSPCARILTNQFPLVLIYTEVQDRVACGRHFCLH